MSQTGLAPVELLARVPAFETLGAEELQQVVAVAVPRSFTAGDVVFREGDESDTCYVVRSGRARAIREHPDGRQITLATFGPGDIFGELALFDDERRSATIEAVDDLGLLGILGRDMRRLMHRHPDIAVKLVVSLGRRLRAGPRGRAQAGRAPPSSAGASRTGPIRRRARRSEPRSRRVSWRRATRPGVRSPADPRLPPCPGVEWRAPHRTPRGLRRRRHP